MNDEEQNDLPGGIVGEEMFADLGHFPTGAIPVDAVLKQGRAIRTRRRVVGGGMLAAAAALTIGVPVAIAGGNGDAAPAAGHAITVDRPTKNVAQDVTFTFTGSLDGAKWSRTFFANCETSPHRPGAQCLSRMAGGDKSPVAEIARDEWHKEGDFYSAVFSPDTDYAVMKLNTGDQVVVPGLATDDGSGAAYFEVPRRTKVVQIFAYGKNGHEIAHTPLTDPSPATHLYDLRKWYQPSGGAYDTSVPTVRIASGTADGQPWSVDVIIGLYTPCFLAKATAADYTVQECPDPGVHVEKNDAHLGHPASTFVLGEVDLKTTGVDVVYEDGTVQHLTPVRSNGHAFVGTLVPQARTVVSVKPVTGTNS